jgi:hypothetical protein
MILQSFTILLQSFTMLLQPPSVPLSCPSHAPGCSVGICLPKGVIVSFFTSGGLLLPAQVQLSCDKHVTSKKCLRHSGQGLTNHPYMVNSHPNTPLHFLSYFSFNFSFLGGLWVFYKDVWSFGSALYVQPYSQM